MLLKDIKTWVTVPPSGIGGAFWVIVKVTTDNGIEGIGECYGIPVSGDIACAMVEDTFERYIAGEDPHHVLQVELLTDELVKNLELLG